MAAGRVTASHAEQQFDVSASARALAFGGALTVGNFNLVGVCHYDNTAGLTGTVTVSGSVNGAYTQLGSYVGSGVVIKVSLWGKENQQASSAETVTVTPSASSYLSFVLEEFSGLVYSGVSRDVQGTNTAASTAHATPSVSAGLMDYVYALMDPTNGTVSSVDSPFALITNLGPIATGEGIATAFHVPASGSEAATFRTSGASDSYQILVALRQRPNFMLSMGMG